MNKAKAQPQTTYLKDYRSPDFLVESVELHFELKEDKTLVHSHLQLCRNNSQGKHQRSLVLMGEDLTLLSLEINHSAVKLDQYTLTEKELIIHNLPDIFFLDIVTEIHPDNNTTLSGLYRSNSLFCTQCEAQGFRRITYYIDRPDVMAPFTTKITANKEKYPTLLSNGNRVAYHEDTTTHTVTWQDSFKKPAYLFALVAGDLAKISDQFVTQSGRAVDLEIYVESENSTKCHHALQSLKHAMAWDEKKYGREYDLDVYMIVAVSDFNMGAMENKGLNIFNAKYVLADEKTATDHDFQAIETVIGHEYFHNWSGNRVTLRDWFQLSLKEGLTVFREQQFSADMGSQAVKRIHDARIIRTNQFAEDAGPMAHPVRPSSYIEINNFYTTTVYYKGAEVIRVLHALLGEHAFRRGMDLYFERHDGQAVTIEDFVSAHEDANQIDLKQFYRWYHQAGTPQIQVDEHYDPKTQQYQLTLSQRCAPTADKSDKKPFLIPIKINLYDKSGKTFAINEHSALQHTEQGHFIVLKEAQQTVVFDNMTSHPVPSLLGDFSAPVKLEFDYRDEDLRLLMVHDQDLFNRWDAMQRLSVKTMLTLMSAIKNQQTAKISSEFIIAIKTICQQKQSDPELLSQLLVLPSFSYVAERLPQVSVAPLLEARKKLMLTIADTLENEMSHLYQYASQNDDGSLSSVAIGLRSLKNSCLNYLALVQKDQWLEQIERQYHDSRNMTDKMGALNALNQCDVALREQLFEDFYQRFKNEPLVVNKWLSLQAAAQLPTTLEKVHALLNHEAFNMGNPNKVYALVNTFAVHNPTCFHHEQGLGYDFLAKRVIELNSKNPQVAARVLEPLTQWRRFEEPHAIKMKQALEQIHQVSHLSEDVYELVSKSLG